MNLPFRHNVETAGGGDGRMEAAVKAADTQAGGQNPLWKMA